MSTRTVAFSCRGSCTPSESWVGLLPSNKPTQMWWCVCARISVAHTNSTICWSSLCFASLNELAFVLLLQFELQHTQPAPIWPRRARWALGQQCSGMKLEIDAKLTCLSSKAYCTHRWHLAPFLFLSTSWCKSVEEVGLRQRDWLPWGEMWKPLQLGAHVDGSCYCWHLSFVSSRCADTAELASIQGSKTAEEWTEEHFS